MPTLLPQQPPHAPKKRRLLDIALNSFMVLSALALTYAVLVREQRYALGQTDPSREIVQTVEETGSIGSHDARFGIPAPR